MLSHHYGDLSANRAVLDGVADEVIDGLAHSIGIAHRDNTGRRRDRDRLLLVERQRLVGIRDFADQARDIHRFAADGDVESVRHCVRNQMIDHRGQAPCGVANVLDLGRDALLGSGGGDQFGHHFGAAEDYAERVLQIMRHRTKNFIFKAVGALQPQPLR